MKRFHRSITAVFVSCYTIKDAMLFSSSAKNICSCSFDAEYAEIKRHAVLILSVLIYWSVHCGSNKAVKWCSATFGSVPSRTQTPCSAVKKDIYAKMFFLCKCNVSVVVVFIPLHETCQNASTIFALCSPPSTQKCSQALFINIDEICFGLVEDENTLYLIEH